MSRQETLGQRLRDLRVRCGISQAQLAFPELSDSYVSLIESDKRVPAPAVIQLLARKLGCSPSYLESGVTDEVADGLRMTLQYAELSLQNGEAAEARDSFAKVIDHPDLIALRGLMYEARWGFARALEACGELEQAVAELENLAELVSPEGNSDDWAWLHLALCRCHRERGDFAAAIEVGERGLEMLAKAQDRWLESGVMLGATLLSVFCEQGDLVHARHFADRLVRYAEEVGSVRARAAAYWEAGIAADFRGDLEAALRLAERAVALLGESDDARNIARLREECGRLLLRVRPDQADRARDLLVAAQQDLAASSAGSIDDARCLTTMAKAEIALGRYTEAIKLAQEALGIAGAGPRLVGAEALIVLGQSYVRLGRNEEAVPTLEEAAKQLEDMRATRHAAQAWFEVAELLGEVGDYVGRANAYRKACACVGLR